MNPILVVGALALCRVRLRPEEIPGPVTTTFRPLSVKEMYGQYHGGAWPALETGLAPAAWGMECPRPH